MKQHITIPLYDGTSTKVPAICFGSLAVHSSVDRVGHTITHIKTGMGVCTVWRHSFLVAARATKRLAALGGWREVDAVSIDDWHTKIISVKSYFPRAELIQFSNILAEVTS